MKIVVCGSRTWQEKEKLERLLDWVYAGSLWTERDFILIQGGARGADLMAGDWAERRMEFNDFVIEHIQMDADWELYGRSAGFRRNIQMLEQEPDLVIAFWDGESKGTMHTVEEARKRNIETWVVTA